MKCTSEFFKPFAGRARCLFLLSIVIGWLAADLPAQSNGPSVSGIKVSQNEGGDVTAVFTPIDRRKGSVHCFVYLDTMASQRISGTNLNRSSQLPGRSQTFTWPAKSLHLLKPGGSYRVKLMLTNSAKQTGRAESIFRYVGPKSSITTRPPPRTPSGQSTNDGDGKKVLGAILEGLMERNQGRQKDPNEKPPPGGRPEAPKAGRVEPRPSTLRNLPPEVASVDAEFDRASGLSVNFTVREPNRELMSITVDVVGPDQKLLLKKEVSSFRSGDGSVRFEQVELEKALKSGTIYVVSVTAADPSRLTSSKLSRFRFEARLVAAPVNQAPVIRSFVVEETAKHGLEAKTVVSDPEGGGLQGQIILQSGVERTSKTIRMRSGATARASWTAAEILQARLKPGEWKVSLVIADNQKQTVTREQQLVFRGLPPAEPQLPTPPLPKPVPEPQPVAPRDPISQPVPETSPQPQPQSMDVAETPIAPNPPPIVSEIEPPASPAPQTAVSAPEAQIDLAPAILGLAMPLVIALIGGFCFRVPFWGWFIYFLMAFLGGLLGWLLAKLGDASSGVVIGTILFPNATAAGAIFIGHAFASGSPFRSKGLLFLILGLLGFCVAVGGLVWSLPQFGALEQPGASWIWILLAVVMATLGAMLVSWARFGLKAIFSIIITGGVVMLWNAKFDLSINDTTSLWISLLALGVFSLFAAIHYLRREFSVFQHLASGFLALGGVVLVILVGHVLSGEVIQVGERSLLEVVNNSLEGEPAKSFFLLAVIALLALLIGFRKFAIVAGVMLVGGLAAVSFFAMPGIFEVHRFTVSWETIGAFFGHGTVHSVLGSATLFNLSRSLHLLGAGKEAKRRLPTPMMFLSYRREDTGDVMGRIYDWLADSLDRRKIFKDVDSIPLGVDFRDYISAEIKKCEVVLVLVGKEWTTLTNAETGARRLDDPKDFVRLEVETALEQSIPVIPLLLQGVAMPSEEDLPESVRRFAFCNGMAIRRDPDFSHDMERLIESLVQLKLGKSS